MLKKQERMVTKTIVRALNTPATRETEVKRLPFRATLIAMFFIMFGGLAGLSLLTAPSASAEDAEEPPSCDGMNVDEGTGECADVVEAESHSRSSSKSRAVSVNGVSINSSVTVLARIRANGTPPAQQTNCRRIPHAMSLWTSYNAEGTTGWHWKFYPAGYRFCRINGATRDPICHNKVKIGVPHNKPPKNAIRGEVKFVKRLRWHVKAVAKADEKVTSLAKAWCTTQSAYAYGEGRGSASAYAVGRGSARGSVLVKLHAKAKAQASGDLSLQLGGKSVIKVQAEVRATAFAKATSEAHAIAKCKDIAPPPPSTPPEITEITTVNDVIEYHPETLTIIGTGTPGETIDLFATAKHGGSITTGKNQTVTVDASGNWTTTVVFTAGEKPATSLDYIVDGNPYTIAAGKDVVWVHVTNAAGQGMWAKSNDFDILTRPPTP